MATAICGQGDVPASHGLALTLPVNHKCMSTGQGKRATTILADQGDIVTIVTDLPYNIRSRHVAPQFHRGTRSMHQSTLHIPTQSYTDYNTTSKQYLESTSRPERVHRCRSQHTSQFSLGSRDSTDWRSSYRHTYISKDVQSPAKLHLPSFENRMNMSEGAGLKQSMSTVGEHQANFWSQYNRVHNKLGVMLGPGVPQERPVRQQYNPLTGDGCGDAWSENNRRISGNRVLYNGYRKHCASSILG